MPSAPFIEIFRYAASGVIFLFYLYIANPALASQLRLSLGDTTIAVGALAVGALTYIMYRAAFFGRITGLREGRGTIAPFFRFITGLGEGDAITYRTWLQQRGQLRTPGQALLLYALIRPQLRQSTERATHFANVHYGYTASLLALPFSFFSFFSGRPWWFGLVLLEFGFVLFLATLRFHQRGENEELLDVMRFANERPGAFDNLAELVRDGPLAPNDE